jgi:hypothetical protein
MSHDASCTVPVPHRHRAPTPREVAEADFAVVVRHPKHCAWRKDIYDGCSCGVTQAVMDLENALAERGSER